MGSRRRSVLGYASLRDRAKIRCHRKPQRKSSSAGWQAGGTELRGGGGGIRTLVTRITGKTVFETAAFNHSATPPRGVKSGGLNPDHMKTLQRWLALCSVVNLAERRGFEPRIRFWRIHDFQSCSFGQLGHLSTLAVDCPSQAQQIRSIQQRTRAHKQNICAFLTRKNPYAASSVAADSAESEPSVEAPSAAPSSAAASADASPSVPSALSAVASASPSADSSSVSYWDMSTL